MISASWPKLEYIKGQTVREKNAQLPIRRTEQ